jgi:hypothetical protein
MIESSAISDCPLMQEILAINYITSAQKQKLWVFKNLTTM